MEDNVARIDVKEWLEQEDSVCRQGRLARLEWLAGLMPEAGLLTFPGGWVAKYLFEESRYCFAYGQFIATVVLGFAFIERTLAALFYGFGRSDLERATISVLLREAHSAGWLSAEEFRELDELRTFRNPLTHFRAPLTDGTVERQTVGDGEFPYSVVEGDARKVMQAVFRLLRTNRA